jgi:hypothetical protein
VQILLLGCYGIYVLYVYCTYALFIVHARTRQLCATYKDKGSLQFVIILLYDVFACIFCPNNMQIKDQYSLNIQ